MGKSTNDAPCSRPQHITNHNPGNTTPHDQDIFSFYTLHEGDPIAHESSFDSPGSGAENSDTQMAHFPDAGRYTASLHPRATPDAGALSSFPQPSTAGSPPDEGGTRAGPGPAHSGSRPDSPATSITRYTRSDPPTHTSGTSKGDRIKVDKQSTYSGASHQTDTLIPCTQIRSQDKPSELLTPTELATGHQNPPSTEAMDNKACQQMYMKIYDVVRASKVPNYLQARIPLPHALNMPMWRHYLSDYHDQQVCDFLEFGWPMNYTGDAPLQPSWSNHTSALSHPAHINKYIVTETHHGALMGPFGTSPFAGCHINPLMTREKRDSDKRRIIMDLSWPPGASVNTGIPKDTYLGSPYKLKLPTVDDAINMIKAQGRGCYVYGLDLERAYRQLRSDPLDWPLLGFKWDDNVYFDVAIPFGIRPGAMACSRATQAICYIHKGQGHSSLCYIDDFFGVSPPVIATALDGFHKLKTLFTELGVKEATEKATPPTTKMFWIGVEFDTIDMIVRVPQFRIHETLSLCDQWVNLVCANRRQLQQLLGKLFYISQCVRPARLFVSRMLDTLRAAPLHGAINLSWDFKQDLLWFFRFLADYNGIHLIDPPTIQETVEIDSCLTGCGGIYAQEFYHATFPTFVLEQNRPICHLEMLNIVVAAKVWAPKWRNKTIIVHCDNSPAVNVLSSGRGRDRFLLQCAREIWFLSAKYDFAVQARHVPGSDMTAADALSRLHLRPGFTNIPDRLNDCLRIHIPDIYFSLTADI